MTGRRDTLVNAALRLKSAAILKDSRSKDRHETPFSDSSHGHGSSLYRRRVSARGRTFKILVHLMEKTPEA